MFPLRRAYGGWYGREWRLRWLARGWAWRKVDVVLVFKSRRPRLRAWLWRRVGNDQFKPPWLQKRGSLRFRLGQGRVAGRVCGGLKEEILGRLEGSLAVHFVFAWPWFRRLLQTVFRAAWIVRQRQGERWYWRQWFALRRRGFHEVTEGNWYTLLHAAKCGRLISEDRRSGRDMCLGVGHAWFERYGTCSGKMFQQMKLWESRRSAGAALTTKSSTGPRAEWASIPDRGLGEGLTKTGGRVSNTACRNTSYCCCSSETDISNNAQ